MAPSPEHSGKGSTGLVSCIVPVYDGERFLAEAIESILGQTYRPLEVIVVDDGSNDRTPDVIRQFGDRIRAVRQENAGPSEARNTGIRMARGEFLAFLDADDVWLRDKLTRQMDFLASRPEVSICFTGIMNYRWTPEGIGPVEEWPQSPYSPCTLVTKAAVFDQVGTFDPALRAAEDTEWFCRVMMRGIRYEVIPEVLVRRRLHDRNLTRSDPPSVGKLLGAMKLALDKKRALRP